MSYEDLKWYAVNDDGESVCEVCGAVDETVTVVGQVELGQEPHVGVTEQIYVFEPCGHRSVVDLPSPA